MCGWRQRCSWRCLVYSSNDGRVSEGIGGVWSTAAMAGARASEASGAAAAMASAARDLVASWATAAMEMADGDSSRLEAARRQQG